MSEAREVEEVLRLVRQVFPDLRLEVERDEGDTDAFVTIPVQQGLDFEVCFSIEPHTTYPFWLFASGSETRWCWCCPTWIDGVAQEIDPLGEFVEFLVGLLSGEMRLVEQLVGERVVYSELQTPSESGNWRVLNRSYHGFVLPWTRRSERILQNRSATPTAPGEQRTRRPLTARVLDEGWLVVFRDALNDIGIRAEVAPTPDPPAWPERDGGVKQCLEVQEGLVSRVLVTKDDGSNFRVSYFVPDPRLHKSWPNRLELSFDQHWSAKGRDPGFVERLNGLECGKLLERAWAYVIAPTYWGEETGWDIDAFVVTTDQPAPPDLELWNCYQAIATQLLAAPVESRQES